MKKILHILKLVKEYWIAVTIATGIVTFIATTAVNLDRKRAAEKKSLEDLRFVKDSTLYYLKQFDTRLYNIERGQVDINTKLSEQANAIRATHDNFMDYISKDKSMTKQEFLRYMQNFNNEIQQEIKKNLGTSCLPEMNQLTQ